MVILALGSGVRSDDWPQWLGPKRDATWRESGIIESFPEGGPRVRWRREIGGGYAGPAVAHGRVYLIDRDTSGSTAVKLPEKVDSWTRGAIPGKERVLCLRETDGKTLWKYEYDCPYTTAYQYANGPRATPAIAQGKVYTLGSEGNLLCLDIASGKVTWERDFKKDYGLRTPVWGWSSHPLIDGNKLITIAGGEGTAAVAFNKDTGEEIWRSFTSREPGYSAPMVYKVGTRRQLIIWHGEAVNGLDPETGKVYWSVETKAFSGMSCSTPLVFEDYLYLMAYKNFSMMIRLDPKQWTASVLWLGNARLGIAGTFSVPVVDEGFIYAVGPDGRFTCAEVQTGKWRWTSYAPSTGGRPRPWANVFTIRIENAGSSGRYVLANDQGDLIFARLTPEGYKETSRANVIEPSHRVWNRPIVWSHPAFANRSVYYRNDREIVCVSMENGESR